jgi:carbon monoxide dehydrogenase subunit G
VSGPLLADTVTLRAPSARVWALLFDVDALRRILPGCESLRATGEKTFDGVLAAKIGFVTVRAQVTARLLDLEHEGHVRLELTGRPLGLAGGFVASIPVDLAATEGGGTRVDYSATLQLTGRLAVFGAPLLRDALRRQVAELVRNLERELTGPARPAEAAEPA